MTAKDVEKSLKKYADPKKAQLLAKYFKTGVNEYAEGDIFIGINVPIQRLIAGQFRDLPISEVEILLNSRIHEHRLTSLIILTYKYQKANLIEQKLIVNFYLNHIKQINNWDLVDLSSPKILGSYFLDKSDKSILFDLVSSKNLWFKRIAVLSTFAFIKNNKFSDSLIFATILKDDKEDLIQKAVGWMLREIGKKDQKVEKEFLDRHYKTMPRTMLRYAIERLNRKDRDFYLKK